MSDEYVKYVGNWIKINCTLFLCTGKIESINENVIILSNAVLSNAKVHTRFIGIDIHLITEMDFIQPPITINKSNENVISNPVNVYTSDIKPPSIKRGGSSSAVNRNLSRQSSQEISKAKNASFSDFGSSRKNSTGNSLNEPEWLNFSLDDINTEFDFDKNLALFDKDSFATNKKSILPENSDSSDSVGLTTTGNHRRTRPNNTIGRKQRYNTISIDSDDFSSHDTENNKPFTQPTPLSINQTSATDWQHPPIKRDILSEFKQIGIIPSSGTSPKPSQHRVDPVNGSDKLLQQPDLVREITQRQLKNGYKRYPAARHSVVKVLGNGGEFGEFSDSWCLESHSQFPVFSIDQRNLLFEAAWELGIESKQVISSVGDSLSDFIIAQVGGFTRINDANMHRAPKIAVLLGKCTASIFAVAVAKCLLKKGCQLHVLIDENKASSDVNYKIDFEVQTLNTMLLKSACTTGYNFITYDAKALVGTSFDFIVSGIESDTSVNSPSELLRSWLWQQRSHILCINPPRCSSLRWTSGVFLGVPIFGPNNFSVGSTTEPDKVATSVPLMFLWNLQFPERVFSFLKLAYRCPFTARPWVRLLGPDAAGDLSAVE